MPAQLEAGAGVRVLSGTAIPTSLAYRCGVVVEVEQLGSCTAYRVRLEGIDQLMRFLRDELEPAA